MAPVSSGLAGTTDIGDPMMPSQSVDRRPQLPRHPRHGQRRLVRLDRASQPPWTALHTLLCSMLHPPNRFGTGEGPVVLPAADLASPAATPPWPPAIVHPTASSLPYVVTATLGEPMKGLPKYVLGGQQKSAYPSAARQLVGLTGWRRAHHGGRSSCRQALGGVPTACSPRFPRERATGATFSRTA